MNAGVLGADRATATGDPAVVAALMACRHIKPQAGTGRVACSLSHANLSTPGISGIRK